MAVALDNLITAFPQRWCDESDELVLRIVQSTRRRSPKTLDDMIRQVVYVCATSFSDPRNLGFDENWFSIFEHSIAAQVSYLLTNILSPLTNVAGIVLHRSQML